MNSSTIYADLALLEPKFARSCKRLHDYLIDGHQTGRLKLRYEIFETFRSPIRQNSLVMKKVSKAAAWQSSHQHGLACDFVPYLSQAEATALGVRPGWYWPEASDPLWEELEKAATMFGLVRPIAWDKPHVEDPRARKVRQAYL